jgi:enoyl-CoA hydratase
MAEPLVLTSRHEGVCRVTLNRPEALNALSLGLRHALIETFLEIGQDDATEVVILTGAGRAFTVGLDLKELGGERSAELGTDPGEASLASRDLSEVMLGIGKPIIGAVNGFAITGGFELALMCDFLIASTAAKFADTHARVGVVPGWGLSQRLPRLIGINRAKELSLTGNFLDAATACEWGLVNRVVAPDQLLPVVESLARDIVSTEPVTRSEIRRIMDAGWMSTLAEGLDTEHTASIAHGQREVRADRIKARRADIQNRGRAQSSESS